MRRLLSLGPVLALAAALLSACPGGSQPTTTPPAFDTFQAAAVVIGQPSFTSTAAPGAPGPASVDQAAGSAASDGTRLFLPDTYQHRVLGFAAAPSASGAAADTVLGQASATSSAAGSTASAWYLPMGLAATSATLAVAEPGGSRVLLLPASTGTGGAAQVAVGWADPATPRHGCAADRLEGPTGVVIAGGKLLVADRGNNRVLIWNAVPSASGTPADLALGQAGLSACAENDSLRSGAAGLRSAATLRQPSGVWSDGTRVVVADRGNNRVLIWSTFPTRSGTPADLVLGQSPGGGTVTAFQAARTDATATGLSGPSAVASDGTLLVVADSGNNRVVGWSAFPTASSAAASFVLGQGSFTASAANDDGQTGTSGGATARTLAYPTGVAFVGRDLVVTDSLNRRFLLFRHK